MIPVNRTRPEEDVGPLWKMGATEQAHAAAVNICWMSVQQRVLERVGLGSQVPRLYRPPPLIVGVILADTSYLRILVIK